MDLAKKVLIVENGNVEDFLAELTLSQIVQLTRVKLEQKGKSEDLIQLYKELALIFGDPEGRMTPIAALHVVAYGHKMSILKQPIVADMILDDKTCSLEMLEDYYNRWEHWLKLPYGNGTADVPCSEMDQNKSSCCGYISKLIGKHFEMTALAITYSMAHLRTNHMALLQYLRLNSSRSMNYSAPMFNVVPICQRPHDTEEHICLGEYQKSFDIVYSSKGICLGFNTPRTVNMYKAMFCHFSLDNP